MPQTHEIEPFEYFLKPGYLIAHHEDTVVRAVLGNAVAVALYDKQARFGGMNHYVFPSTRERAAMTPQYGNVAILALLRILCDMGARPDSLEAQILGGAVPPEDARDTLGQDNVAVARKTLKRYNIPVVSTDVGGSKARKVLYHTGTSELVVIKVDKIRANDWFRLGQDLRFADQRR